MDAMTLLYGKITKNENEPEIEKVKEFIEVPYKLKDTIKSKGAIWNKDKKSWFIYEDNENKEEIYNMLEEQKKIKKIYIEVPFKLKNEIKNLGGSWDKDKKSWFIYEDNENMKEIKKLIFDYNRKKEKIYLNIPYDLKNEAKQDGCKWCKNMRKWTITEENNNYNYYMQYAV